MSKGDSLNMNPLLYNQLVFDKGTTTIQWVKDSWIVFPTNTIERIAYHLEKISHDIYLKYFTQKVTCNESESYMLKL